MTATPNGIAEYEQEIEEISRMGGDLTRPHHVGHSLRFARREDAESAGQRLAADGVFDVSLTDESFDGSWHVYAGQEQVLNAHHLERTRSALERLAGEFKGQYEDWEVGIHMDGWPECGCAWPES